MKNNKLVLFISVWILVMALHPILLSAETTSDVKKLFEQSLQTKDKGLRQQLREQIVEISPDSAYGIFSKAWLMAKRNDIPTAITLYGKVVEMEPKLAEAYYNRGLLYEKTDNVDLALKDFNASLAVNPKYFGPFYYKMKILVKKKQIEEVKKEIKKFNIQSIESADEWNSYGLLLKDLDQNQEALKAFNTSISKDPNHTYAYLNRGDLYALKLNQPELALKDYNRSIEISVYPANLYARANYYADAKQLDKALLDYNVALEQIPDDFEMLTKRGMALLQSNRVEEGLADLNHAIQINPEYSLAYYIRGFVSAGKKAYQEAIDDFSKAISLNPQFANAYLKRALMEFNLEDTQRACADLTQANSLGAKEAKEFLTKYCH